MLKTFYTLFPELKNKLFILVFLSIFSSILDILSLGLIGPLIGMIVDKNFLLKFPIIYNFIEYLNIFNLNIFIFISFLILILFLIKSFFNYNIINFIHSFCFRQQVELRNKELNDEITEIECNSIILDLPEPHKLIKWAERSLVLGGKLLCYVPTINQVEKLLSFLDGWAEVEISDIMHRNWQINLDALRPKTNSLGHTGFILTSRLLNK